MRRQGQYAEADINSMVAAQLQHYQAQQRLQQLPGNSYAGRDPAQTSEDHQYMALKAGQVQWDRDGAKAANQPPPYAYNEGQGAEGTRSFYDGHRSDLKFGLEKQANKDPRGQSRTDKIEAGYDDNTLPQTFDGLEQKFHEDIVLLSKEQQDAEDAENARHRERLNEINAQYQEKLLALRAHQATHREEFLRKESLARQQQYQQSSMSNYANNAIPGEPHGYPPPPAAAPPAAAGAASGVYGEAHQGYASGHYESFGERPEYGGSGRGHGFEQRGQYPGGRAYNSGGRRF